MKEISFKTNFKCQGCIDKVADTLNNHLQIEAWEVNLQSSEKTLSVKTSLSASELETLIAQKGYKITLK